MLPRMCLWSSGQHRVRSYQAAVSHLMSPQFWQHSAECCCPECFLPMVVVVVLTVCLVLWQGLILHSPALNSLCNHRWPWTQIPTTVACGCWGYIWVPQCLVHVVLVVDQPGASRGPGKNSTNWATAPLHRFSIMFTNVFNEQENTEVTYVDRIICCTHVIHNELIKGLLGTCMKHLQNTAKSQVQPFFSRVPHCVPYILLDSWLSLPVLFSQ